MNAQRFLMYKNSPVSYYRFGYGPEAMIALHGYGQSAADFLFFEDVLAPHFTVIAIDFFWHGKSEWREEEDFTEEDMKLIVDGILQQEQIESQRLSLCSFSMGARIARALVRSFPSRIHYFILLSPPTFSFNRFLEFTTNNPIGLGTFRYFVRNYKLLMWWVRMLQKAGLLNRSVSVFSSKFMSKPDRLEKVFKTWFAQRKLKTDFRSFAKLLDKHSIQTILIVGKNDPITPPRGMIRYVRKLKNGHVMMIRKKHELATPETRQALADLFSRKT